MVYASDPTGSHRWASVCWLDVLHELHVIGVLCSWCLTLDVAMVVLFFGVTRYNILGNFLPISKQTNDKLQKVVKNSYDMLAMWSVLVLGVLAIILKFGSDLFA